MKKLPIALSLLAVVGFSLAACKDDDDEVPVQVPTLVPSVVVSMSPMPDCPSPSVSVSPSPVVSVSVSPSGVDNDKNHNGALRRIDYLERKAARPDRPGYCD